MIVNKMFYKLTKEENLVSFRYTYLLMTSRSIIEIKEAKYFKDQTRSTACRFHED